MPVKEILGHLEILQLDGRPTTDEHPEHLVIIIIIIIITTIIIIIIIMIILL